MKIRNYVLILPDAAHEAAGGIAVGSFVNPYKHISVTGTVLEVPEDFACYDPRIRKLLPVVKRHPVLLDWIRKLNNRSLEFDTTMELSRGDRVMFNYASYLQAEDSGLVFNIGGEVAMLVRYDLIYAVIEPVVKMINGYLFVEPEVLSKDEQVVGGLQRLLEDDTMQGVGRIKHMGKPLRSYVGYPKHDDRNMKELRVGQKVFFKNAMGSSCEYKYHQTLNPGGKPLFRMQRKDILAWSI